jgi:hypothetical protein
LYEATEFPWKWRKKQILLSGVEGHDATLIEHGGKWWMFLAQPTRAGWPCEELFLYMADSPLGPWSPHPMNPIKSDVRNLRPAGRLFVKDGKLIRPAQDCSVRYGYAIAINEVTALDAATYSEREISRIEPCWRRGLLGNHTLNSEGGMTVIDGLRQRLRFTTG